MMTSDQVEMFLKFWYQFLCEDDPILEEGGIRVHANDSIRVSQPYTFDQFKVCPMVQCALKAVNMMEVNHTWL